MFGMGFFEIVVIVIVAIIFLGPDKLPQAIIDVVKFLKVARKTIHDAKQTLDNELHISALQKEASNYHEHFNAQVDSITKDMQLKEIDDLFSEYKALPASVNPQNPAAIDSGVAGEVVVRESTPESTPKKNVKSTKSSKGDRVKSSKSTKSSEPAKTTSSKLLKSPKLTKSPESTHQESLAESKALAKAAKSPASSVSKTHSPKSHAKSRTKS